MNARTYSPPILKQEDLDVVGDQFGLRFVRRGPPTDNHVIVELYSEDDEAWL